MNVNREDKRLEACCYLEVRKRRIQQRTLRSNRGIKDVGRKESRVSDDMKAKRTQFFKEEETIKCEFTNKLGRIRSKSGPLDLVA